MKKFIWMIVASLLLIAIGGAAYFYLGTAHSDQPVAAKALICRDMATGCSLDALSIKADRTPEMMRPFKLEVNLPEAKAVYASFSMRDMDIGFNRYRLVQQPSGGWQAEVTLPICTQSRSDWIMSLEIEGKGSDTRYQVAFETSGGDGSHTHHHHE
jgi:hypothetical protein